MPVSAPPLGARVVLRFRRPAGSVPSQSDVIGTLESLAPEVRVRTAGGDVTSVPQSAVVALKAIPPRPVRTASIRGLEHAAAFADPTVEREWVAGWVARAGVDALSSSAVFLADPSMPEGGYFRSPLGEPTLRALSAWYAARGLPLQLRMPDRLVRPPAGWLGHGERVVLVAEVADLPTAAAVADRGRVLMSRSPDDALWAGLVLDEDSAVVTRAHLAALMAEAAQRGADRAYLELKASDVDPDTGVAAVARALGFTDHHRVRHVRLELDHSASSEA